MSKQSNLTVKGQVTIPKDVRDALGLKPGEPVEFDWNAAGEAVIRKGLRPNDHEKRYRAALANIDHAIEKYKHLRTNQTTDEYMAEIREPLP
ncbi:MAG: AbrB/MazE/SpoVT family DNA-binding domain-containing protein [Sphingomonas sp.]